MQSGAAPEVAVMPADVADLKAALGRFCTGIVVITGRAGDQLVGFTAQSFVSVSLQPPLVSFCPDKASESWPRLRDAAHFCVNVLDHAQQDLCFRFAKKGVERFAGINTGAGTHGGPIIGGALAWFECAVEAEHDAGDHTIVVGRVLSFGSCEASDAEPLLFYQRRPGRFRDL
ncbi:flavin reductase family protein [Phenylobacterium sp.]|uniref:flavin reductase family protein n=1 Tax=Phenylobacterium sp. TaxID=1871053 RepID=UPI0027302130|nr:flavin reductase family protein [Phenylobacterium sp.]MDP1597904.1 flavin reductase family protein [Phenylobacterium sp.]MDP3592392.1 flavin reductase family protein [Phenylobacterium sp.]